MSTLASPRINSTRPRFGPACVAWLLLLWLPAVVQAQIRWTTNNGTITITGYSYAGSGEVVIPDTITGLPVTSIRDSAFFVEDGLTSVTIPNSVTRIGDRAFFYCPILNTVMIGTGVTRIGDGAFQGCNSLTNVTLPASVTSIGGAAFLGCTMTSVTIPNSVTNIGVAAFSYCANLGAISVDALNSAYSSVAGVLFNTNKTVLIQFPGGRTGSYVIPASVNDVGDYAFSGCSGLISVAIPDSVTSIGVSAFSECTSLTGVTFPVSITSIGSGAFQSCVVMTSLMMPDSITSIGDNAFAACASLTSAAIPNNVISIGGGAFYQCVSLASVTIGSSVTSIGSAGFNNCTSLTNVAIGPNVISIEDEAFGNCTSLTRVAIPNSVTSIGSSAFSACTGLTGVLLGTGVTSIGEGAFGGCVSLNSITVDALNSVYSSVAGVLFNKHKTVLIQCPEGRTGTYAIPTSVTSIGSGAFNYCTSLISVTIPSSITNIDVGAFDYCIGLTSVTVGNGVTSIEAYAFASCYRLAWVFFQGDAPVIADSAFIGANIATVYYLPDTTGWGTTFGDRPAALWNPQIQTNDPSFGLQANQFGFTITGTSGLVIVVEACANLANPVWFSVGTNALTGGSSYFSDPAWTNFPTRLYRVRSP